MFLELRTQGTRTKYYLAHSYRTSDHKIRKLRKFLGYDLTQGKLALAIPKAEAYLRTQCPNSISQNQIRFSHAQPLSSDLSLLSLKLRTFSRSSVTHAAHCYNKSFHAKLFTLFASSESELCTYAQRLSPHYRFCFAFMKHDEGQWFLDEKSLLSVRKWVLSCAKRSPGTIFSLYDMWQKDWQMYHHLSSQLLHLDLAKCSDLQLYTLFEQFYRHYVRVGSVAYLCDSFMSTGSEDFLDALLLKELSRMGQKSLLSSSELETVRILTSPVHLSFTLEAEFQLLKIATSFVQKYPKDLPSLERLQIESPELFRKLQAHQEAYFWIQNNYYTVRLLDLAFFYDQLVQLVTDARKNHHNLLDLLCEKQHHLTELRTSQRHLLSRLGLSSFLRNLLTIAGLFAKWKDERKSGVYLGMHHFDRFLSEIAKRTPYTQHQLTFTVFPEIKGLFLEKKDMHRELSLREKQTFFAVTPQGYYLASGKQAERYFTLLGVQDHCSVVELRGVAACVGYARGRVRIVRNNNDMEAFQVGEILVTNQTTPEFVPLMKKAAGIITEQGGITSHAAVVSRELNVPCIIGTKIATSALMNGEIVELDAQHGIVRRMR